MKRFDRMLSAMLAWSWMPGIEPESAVRHRRAEHVEQSRRRQADEDDLVLEDRRVEPRLLPRQNLLLRRKQLTELVGRIGTLELTGGVVDRAPAPGS